MHRFMLAIRIFFYTLFHAEAIAAVEQILSGGSGTPQPAMQPPAATAPAAAPPPPRKEPPTPPPVRNEALILLATLQREARFVDFVKEPIAGYSDAQVGAAVRDIHRECGKVLDRLFGLEPVLPDEEGADVEVTADADRYRLTGPLHGNPPYRGRMMHHGWRATKYEVPLWSGSTATARIVAPAEVEVAAGPADAGHS